MNLWESSQKPICTPGFPFLTCKLAEQQLLLQLHQTCVELFPSTAGVGKHALQPLENLDYLDP